MRPIKSGSSQITKAHAYNHTQKHTQTHTYEKKKHTAVKVVHRQGDVVVVLGSNWLEHLSSDLIPWSRTSHQGGAPNKVDLGLFCKYLFTTMAPWGRLAERKTVHCKHGTLWEWLAWQSCGCAEPV